MIHILVLEDDAKLNRIVCTYLNDSGFAAKGCLNANDAYDELYNSLYDLIISDIMMPEVDGFTFARMVRQVNRHIPILFMSARDDLPAKQKGFQLGIDDYMVKPVDLEELLLPGAGPAPPGQYRGGAENHRGQSHSGCRRPDGGGGWGGDSRHHKGV